MRNPFRLLIPVLAALCVAPAFAGSGDDDWDSRWDWHSRSDFAWQVQVDSPAKDLGRALDNRVGLGLGMQWTRYRDHGFANRTRLEWNVFPEGNPVGLGGVKTKANNYVLSFDRLYHLSGESRGLYILGGLGAVRWNVDRTIPNGEVPSTRTTKLAITAGAGFRFNKALSAEARYLVSSVNRTYDGNVLQASVGMRF
jgi:hypothetical protein